MFLVEADSGQRRRFRSAGALGVAIRIGELGPRARIFHQTANRWLPITVHPEYRKAEADREELSAGQWRDRQWTFLAARPSDLPADVAPSKSAQSGSTLVLIPPGPEPSWLELALRYLLRLASR